MVVAAVQVAGLVEGKGVEQPIAGLEEALHVRELQAVAVALHLLDVHVVTHGRVLGELQLVAAGGERSGQGRKQNEASKMADERADRGSALFS